MSFPKINKLTVTVHKLNLILQKRKRDDPYLSEEKLENLSQEPVLFEMYLLRTEFPLKNKTGYGKIDSLAAIFNLILGKRMQFV